METGDDIRTRLAKWNQRSGGSDSYRADYFAIGDKPKIRVEISQETPIDEIQHRFVDKYTKIESAGNQQTGMGFAATIMLASALVIFLGLFFRPKLKTRCTKRHQENTAEKNADFVSQNLPAASAKRAVDQCEDDTKSNTVPHLLAEQTRCTPRQSPQQEVKCMQHESIGEYKMSVSTVSARLDVQEVEMKAKEMTIFADANCWKGRRVTMLSNLI